MLKYQRDPKCFLPKSQCLIIECQLFLHEQHPFFVDYMYIYIYIQLVALKTNFLLVGFHSSWIYPRSQGYTWTPTCGKTHMKNPGSDFPAEARAARPRLVIKALRPFGADNRDGSCGRNLPGGLVFFHFFSGEKLGSIWKHHVVVSIFFVGIKMF